MTIMGERPNARHLDRLDGIRPTMAKALKNLETPAWRQGVGRAIERTLALAGLSQKEGAALIGRDQAQVARWISGDERPQFDLILAVDVFRQPLVQALSELAGAEVEVNIRLRPRKTA